MSDCCDEGYCGRCHGMILGLIGVLMLINLFVWPMWLGIDGWIGFFAVMLILAGVWKSLMPGCKCKSEECCKNDAVQEKSAAQPVHESAQETVAVLPKVSKKKK